MTLNRPHQPERTRLVKVLIGAGARPQFVKLGPIAQAFAMTGDIEHIIVHTGQHYEEPFRV